MYVDIKVCWFNMWGMVKEGRERMGAEEALEILRGDDPLAAGKRADSLRRSLHKNRAYYAVNAAISYSNICDSMCPICSFARREGEQGAYLLRPEDIYAKVRNYAERGAEEIHIIGGVYSKLPLDYYLDVCKAVKAAGDVNLVAFTVSECVLMSEVSGKRLEEVMNLLRESGVDALPGGGAEIFDSSVRSKITPKKISGEQWISAMRTAHKCGLKTNATMLYGHIETPESIVSHLEALRSLQDETGGFKAFVPLPFRRGASPIPSSGGGVLDLKICSLARIFLDNFPHVRVPLPHFGARFAQVLLNFGADDVGGTHWFEEVASSAGAPRELRTEEFVRKTIESAGFVPVKTNSNYAI